MKAYQLRQASKIMSVDFSGSLGRSLPILRPPTYVDPFNITLATMPFSKVIEEGIRHPVALDFFLYRPIILVADPSFVHDMLINNSSKIVRNTFVPGNSVLTVEGKEHARHVSVLRRALHSRHVGTVSQAVRGALAASGGTQSVVTSDRLHSSCRRLILSAIIHFTFGPDESRNAELCAAAQLVSDETQSLLGAALAMITWTRVLRRLFRSALSPRRLRELSTSWDTLDYQEEVLRKPVEDEDTVGFLSALVRANRSAKQPLTFEELKDNAQAIQIAGQDSTGSFLLWALYRLALHPEWQDTLRREKDAATQPRTDAFLKEVLRMHPPFFASFPRVVTAADTVLGGYRCPVGTQCLINIVAMHYNPTLWTEDPTFFDPNRWGKGGADVSALPYTHRYAYCPWGVGTTSCVGQRLAQELVSVVLQEILMEWKLSLAPGVKSTQGASVCSEQRKDGFIEMIGLWPLLVTVPKDAVRIYVEARV